MHFHTNANINFIIGIYFLTYFCQILCLSVDKKLLLIVFDGFSNKYLENELVQTILSPLNKKCAKATEIIPTYPTNSIANLHSLATGKEPSIHGVTGHRVYDTLLNKSLTFKDPAMYRFGPNVEPIWITNQRNGGISGCMMWPGTEFSYFNERCYYVEEKNIEMSLKARVKKIFSWFFSKTPSANLVIMNIEEPYSTAENYGPSNNKTISKVISLANFMVKLFASIQNQENGKNLNIIFASSHGIGEATIFIDLAPFLNGTEYKIYGSNGRKQIIPKKGYENAVKKALKKASYQSKLFSYHEADSFRTFVNSTNAAVRMGPIILIANEGAAFVDDCEDSSMCRRQQVHGERKAVVGYNTKNSDTYGFFYACGSMFKENFITKRTPILSLFMLICSIIGIDICGGQVIDSSLKILDVINKRDKNNENPLRSQVLYSIGGYMGTFVMVYAIIIYLKKRKKKKQQDQNNNANTNVNS